MNDVDKGSGPNRRLYLKCETFGVFVNTIHAKFSKKADSRIEEMINALALVNETLMEIRDTFENLNGAIENRMGNEVLVEPNDIYY